MGCSTIGISIILALGMRAAPLAADAQPLTKVYRIGWLTADTSPPSPSSAPKAFLQGLRELEYVEGQNLVIESRYAEWRVELLPALAADLVRLKVDVIVVGTPTAIFAATQATTTIPIVIYAAMHPVDAGLVARMARPGNNITGVRTQLLELNGKWLEWLKEAVPHVSRVAVLRNPSAPGAADVFQEVQRVAQALGVELQSLEVRSPDAFESAFDAATREGARALLMLPALLCNANEGQLAALAVKSRLPAIFWRRGLAEAGGLMPYGPREPDLLRRVAVLVDQILRGAKPGDLPIEQPMRFELVLNLKTAEALGLTLPPHLLVLADEVIQ